ncbi:MAG: DUF882 domain-containing protein [Myxococcales bacterium]|nr:DUF882 domain-containing protein [Myxococcales bacterium]MCB9579456.1 DUF882 domain-containing protein [Polyangiaceae bacterium]
MPRLVPILLVSLACALAAPSALAKAKHKAAPALKTHVVYPGQTLGMIAKRYNVSVDALCRANGIRRKSPIQPKQKLYIPARDDKDGSETAERVARETSAQSKAEPKKKAKPAEKKPAEEPATKPASLQLETKKAKKTTKEKDPYARRPRRRGYLDLTSFSGKWKGYAVRRGKVTTQGQTGFERVLASWRTGQREHIHERLIRMLTKVSDHFGGRPIKVISGFRPYRPTQYTAHSRHNAGHAVDFYIPGVPNEVVRDYCRTLHKVGVGYYPNSTFIHLDVREMDTYWIDYSGPGQAPRYANSKGQDPGVAEKEAGDGT